MNTNLSSLRATQAMVSYPKATKSAASESPSMKCDAKLESQRKSAKQPPTPIPAVID
jgi:hypothetical protein